MEHIRDVLSKAVFEAILELMRIQTRDELVTCIEYELIEIMNISVFIFPTELKCPTISDNVIRFAYVLTLLTVTRPHLQRDQMAQNS